ncbi:hypothetical protein [Streptomyces sp. NPDC002788]
MLSLALPKGSSLERRTLSLLAAAGLEVTRPSERAYRGTIAYGGPIRVFFFKPREIPLVVADGAFDAGLTGADWVEETEAKVESVVPFTYSRPRTRPGGWCWRFRSSTWRRPCGSRPRHTDRHRVPHHRPPVPQGRGNPRGGGPFLRRHRGEDPGTG